MTRPYIASDITTPAAFRRMSQRLSSHGVDLVPHNVHLLDVDSSVTIMTPTEFANTKL